MKRWHAVAFWIIVAAIVAWTIYAVSAIWSGLRPAACCGAEVCRVQKHHI